MSLLKVDQTLMLRRGNWSEGILNHLMRGSLSERFLFLPSVIPPDHMADLYMTKELPGLRAASNNPALVQGRSEGEPPASPRPATAGTNILGLQLSFQGRAYWNIYGLSPCDERVINSRLKVLVQALRGDLFRGWYQRWLGFLL